MTAKQPPRLLRSGLTGAVFVVTRYVEHDDGTIEALDKTNVTDDFVAIVENIVRPQPRGVD